MNIRAFLFNLFLACFGSCLVSLVLVTPGFVWPEAMILFGLLALLVFLYMVLPLHALAVIMLVYASLKYRVFIKVIGYYLYLAIWCAVNAVVFEEYLFTKVPEQFEQWRYEQTHKDDLTLLRALLNENSSPELVASLLEKGANPNEIDRQFGTALLSTAARKATVDEVKLLVDAGALLNYQTDLQFGDGPLNIVQLSTVTALSLASLNTNVEQRFLIASFLLERGADARIGEPVLGACGYGDIQLIALLIENGADLWARDARGRGCFFYAASAGYIELINFLLEQQIAIDPMDQQPPSLIDIAATKGHIKIVIKLMELGYLESKPIQLERLLENTEDAQAKQKLRSLLETRASARTAKDQI